MKTVTGPNARPASGKSSPAALAALPDAELLDRVARQTFRYFWEGGHPVSGLAYDRHPVTADAPAGPAAIGGTGFGLMALVTAVERRWITRAAALERLERIVGLLGRAQRHHGAWPHFIDGATGATIAFGPNDDGGDLVETSFLCMGLLCVRQYFGDAGPREQALRARITELWEGVEWDWYTQGRDLLYWHWSPNVGWAMNHEIRGWNECLVTYVLAAAAPRHRVAPAVYHRGFAAGPDFRNGNAYYGIELPLGPPFGGPLFFAHYSFCGLDPNGLRDRYANYGDLNRRHVQINRAHCIANPGGYAGYGAACWGLTASDDPAGYAAHAPGNDNGTIAPTAALASLPYAPAKVLPVLRYLLAESGGRLWGRYGFVDAFCPQRKWVADAYLAIDQGPIVIMFENHRSGLLWNLFMDVPEVRDGLRRLEFDSSRRGAETAG